MFWFVFCFLCVRHRVAMLCCNRCLDCFLFCFFILLAKLDVCQATTLQIPPNVEKESVFSGEGQTLLLAQFRVGQNPWFSTSCYLRRSILGKVQSLGFLAAAYRMLTCTIQEASQPSTSLTRREIFKSTHTQTIIARGDFGFQQHNAITASIFEGERGREGEGRGPSRWFDCYLYELACRNRHEQRQAYRN